MENLRWKLIYDILKRKQRKIGEMLFLTQQSSCRQHQVTVIVAYSSYSLKDTDLCSSPSNIMYRVQAYTLQPPAVKIESFSLNKRKQKVLAARYWILNNHINFINKQKITSTSQSISIAHMLEVMSFWILSMKFGRSFLHLKTKEIRKFRSKSNMQKREKPIEAHNRN